MRLAVLLALAVLVVHVGLATVARSHGRSWTGLVAAGLALSGGAALLAAISTTGSAALSGVVLLGIASILLVGWWSERPTPSR